MLEQVLTIDVKPHRPDVIGRDNCHGVDQAAMCSDIRTRDNTPVRAIPVLDQGVHDVVTVVVRSHSPYIIRQNGRHPNQEIIMCANIRTRNHASLATALKHRTGSQ